MERRSTAESKEIRVVKKEGGCHFRDLDYFAANRYELYTSSILTYKYIFVVFC